MTTNYMSLLVGAHFRPPAKAVIESLPAGAELTLEPEPENQYDEYAIKVLVRAEAVPASQQDDLREKCLLMGADWDELLLATEPLHLGYLISATNKKLGAWTPNTIISDVLSRGPDWTARLGFSDKGEPMVIVSVEDEAEPPVSDGEDNS
jgi:hypothetical protein